VIVNVHHFADSVVDYLRMNQGFGMHIEVSREETLLDTGGGLKKASDFFLRDSHNPEDPFILHNVDVISTIDLQGMLRFHKETQALATLAVQRRKTSRYLLFDQRMRLCGRRSEPEVEGKAARPAEGVEALAFCGIHVISPRLLTMMTEEGAFSIIASYLRLAAGGERVLGFRDDDAYWRDLGTPESLARAAGDLERNKIVY
jgi:NDP-sugar pyrophosphorylase family protein